MAFGHVRPVDRQAPSRTSRALRAAIVIAGVAVPLTLLPTIGQAAPSLTIAEAQAQLEALQTKQAAAVEAFNEGNIALTAAKRSVDVAQASVTRQQAKVAQAQAQLSGLARMAYMTGGVDPVTGLLSGQGSADIIERVGNLDQIARARATQTTLLKAEQTQLSGLQQTTKDKLALANTAQANLADARKNIEGLVAAQANVLQHLQAKARAQLLAQQAAEREAAQRAAAQATANASVTQLSYSSGGGSASTPTSFAPVAPSQVAGTVIAAALSKRGAPYSYGAAGPNSFDCSGLVMWAFAHAGISLPHSAAAQYGYGTHVSRSQLQPGDIVFFAEGGGIGHDGIFLGGDSFIDANHTGGWVDVRNMSYYSGFVGGTRL